MAAAGPVHAARPHLALLRSVVLRRRHEVTRLLRDRVENQLWALHRGHLLVAPIGVLYQIVVRLDGAHVPVDAIGAEAVAGDADAVLQLTTVVLAAARVVVAIAVGVQQDVPMPPQVLVDVRILYARACVVLRGRAAVLVAVRAAAAHASVVHPNLLVRMSRIPGRSPRPSKARRPPDNLVAHQQDV